MYQPETTGGRVAASPGQPHKMVATPPARANEAGQEIITTVGPNDILLGRGAPFTENPGNIKFRELVGTRHMYYSAAKRQKDKQLVAWRVLKEIEARGGRFLKQLPTRSSGDSSTDKNAEAEAPTRSIENAVWVVVQDQKEILTKIKQLLRDLAPESMSKRIHRRLYRYRKLGRKPGEKITPPSSPLPLLNELESNHGRDTGKQQPGSDQTPPTAWSPAKGTAFSNATMPATPAMGLPFVSNPAGLPQIGVIPWSVGARVASQAISQVPKAHSNPQMNASVPGNVLFHPQMFQQRLVVGQNPAPSGVAPHPLPSNPYPSWVSQSGPLSPPSGQNTSSSPPAGSSGAKPTTPTLLSVVPVPAVNNPRFPVVDARLLPFFHQGVPNAPPVVVLPPIIYAANSPPPAAPVATTLAQVQAQVPPTMGARRQPTYTQSKPMTTQKSVRTTEEARQIKAATVVSVEETM